mgnify:CR=1 FL=1
MSRADAVPKVEKPIASTNRPYTVMGKRYVPMTGDKPLTQVGYGSWYGKQFHGKNDFHGRNLQHVRNVRGTHDDGASELRTSN